MNSTTRILLGTALIGIFAKLMLGGKADKGADIPGLIRQGALLIDTRTADEFSHGHIEGAINIPHDVIAEIEATPPEQASPLFIGIAQNDSIDDEDVSEPAV